MREEREMGKQEGGENARDSNISICTRIDRDMSKVNYMAV